MDKEQKQSWQDKRYLEWLELYDDINFEETLKSLDYRKTRALEIIARCQIKQNEMAESAIKKTQELYEANMAMIRERYDKEIKLDKESQSYKSVLDKELLKSK